MTQTNITHGITADERGWLKTIGTMPRATNAYWTDPRPVASQLRYQDSKIIAMPIIDADARAIAAARFPVVRCAICNEPVITHNQSSPDCGDKD